MLGSIDKVGGTKFKINEMLAHVSYGLVMAPQPRNTIRMGIPDGDAMRLLNPDHRRQIFPPVILKQPDINNLVDTLNVPEKTRIQISMAIRMTHDESFHRVQA